MTLWAFNRPFKILGCDEFTAKHYLDNYNKVFPIGGFDQVYQVEQQGNIIKAIQKILINSISFEID